MRVFVTGASGWIGSAATAELLAAGHTVVGLARSADSAAAIEKLGAEPVRGSLDEPESLRGAAEAADAVVHLAYNHDFSDMLGAAATDRAVIDLVGDVLAGTDKPFLAAGGTLGLAQGRLATEQDRGDPSVHPRIANTVAVLDLADRGVRSSVARFAPTVHGDGDRHGFVARLVDIARDKGVAGYVGDGQARWAAVHQRDAGSLVRLAVEKAPAGSALHAVGEPGVTTGEIAEAIGRQLGLPVESIEAELAQEHFGWLGMFFGADCPASNDETRRVLGWEPTHPGLIADLDAGYYTR